MKYPCGYKIESCDPNSCAHKIPACGADGRAAQRGARSLAGGLNFRLGAVALICLATALSTACSSSSSSSGSTMTTTTTTMAEVVGITATSGSAQSGAVGKTFSAPFKATVTSNAIATSGEKVTFTAPTSGASGTFANGTNTETDVTGTNGVATSSTFTANTTAGNFMVMAAVTGAPAPVVFALTNIATTSYSFYLSGQEAATFSYYALAGSVLMDSSGNVLGGEQDYNDGLDAFFSPQPAGDKITGGTLTVDSTTGQGTLTLITNNPTLGVPNTDGVTSTETFAVQFVNAAHALMVQFDGSATSSGSMDLQTLPSEVSGNYAFAVSGFESSGLPAAYGGVFTTDGATISTGTIDINDAENFGVTVGTALTGTMTAPDAYGRGTLKGVKVAGTAVKLNYYVVNSRAIRLIDVDLSGSALGSAFSQGAGTFSNTSLGSSVLAVGGTIADPYAALAQFTPSNTSSSPADFAGVGDESEPNNGILTRPQPSKFSGTYSVASNGYGNLAFKLNGKSQGLGNIVSLGAYLTDPTLNLNDPNNTSAGSAVGGALVVDLDDGSLTGYAIPGGSGVIVPQTDAATATADFAGNYAAGWQDFNPNCGCNYDMVAQGSMVAGGTLSLTGAVSDPAGSVDLGVPAESTGDTFTGVPLPDATNLGRYTMIAKANELSSFIDGATGPLYQVTIYQANGGQLFWLYYDQADFNQFNSTLVALGQLEQQDSLAGLPAASKAAGEAQGKR